MMLVAFVAPYLLDATTRFAEATAGLPGVELALITCEPQDRVPEPLRHRLAAHWRIGDPLDAGQIGRGVQAVSERVAPAPVSFPNSRRVRPRLRLFVIDSLLGTVSR